LIGTLLLSLVFSGVLTAVVLSSQPKMKELWVAAVGVLLVGVVAGGDLKLIKAGKQRDATGKITAFTLGLGEEIVPLYTGMTWAQVDRYKWCARGLIDEPHVFHVFSDGSVEINWERIALADLEGEARLQRQVNSRHGATFSPSKTAATAPALTAAATVLMSGSDSVRFKVKVDRFGHMQICCSRGGESEETGLRGIHTLIANGSMLRPKELHVDPMQRAIEIDGVRFECTEEGARQLEIALNGRYTPASVGDRRIAIEVKENAAASTGFDIHFMIIHAGVPMEVKGHLTQEMLDILQDHTRCDLLQSGIQLRLSPPNLLVRKRRPDMGEDKIPGIQDTNYLQATAARIQEILNHPVIRKGAAAQPTQRVVECPSNVTEIRVVRNPADRKRFWMECTTTDGETHGGKAFTHHNVAELQHRGFFLPHLDVCLSLDHRVLSVLNKQKTQEESITISEGSPDADLLRAGEMLTKALKPYVRVVGKPPAKVQLVSNELVTAPASAKGAGRNEGAVEQRETDTLVSGPLRPVRAEAPAGLASLFREVDPVQINREIFRRLSSHLAVQVQDARLSLPLVFDDRHFEIINFEGGEIEDVSGLRDEWFYGFYLSHVSERKAILVYACNGTHIEWGPDKCVLRQLKTEPEVYPTSALLGVAQDANNEFVFIVQRAFKEWIKEREKRCVDVTVYFMTTSEIASAADKYKWIWPERSETGPA
jgi:hypothetical protein